MRTDCGPNRLWRPQAPSHSRHGKSCPAGRAVAAAVVLATLAAPLPAIAQPDRAGELRAFKDWVIGCDNLTTCTALGLTADDSENQGYLKVSRAGGPAAAARVAVSVFLEVAATRPSLVLSFAGKGAGGKQTLPATADGDFLTARLEGAEAGAFLAALLPATGLAVTVRDGGKDLQTTTISLVGSSATLRFMDAEQGRAGTVTALVARGGAAAAAVPAPPSPPVVSAVRLTELPEPLPKPPVGVAAASPEDCPGPPQVIAFALSPTRTLWGACAFSGAYNVSYAFAVAGGGKPQPVHFDVPGRTADADADVLTNPYLSEDGTTLSAFSKGRGIGDCGEAYDWAWDGERFSLLSFSAMDPCRGVPPDDWPVLYTAERR